MQGSVFFFMRFMKVWTALSAAPFALGNLGEMVLMVTPYALAKLFMAAQSKWLLHTIVSNMP